MGKNKNQKKRKRSSSLDEKQKDDKGKKGIEKQNPNQKKSAEGSKAPTAGAAAVTTNIHKYVGNPLLEQQTKFLQQKGLTDKERNEFFSPEIPAERRAELWMAQADLGEELVNRYAWATPDATAIRILKEFSPLVEIGCGSNAYWCHILRQHGIDIVGYDVNVSSGGQIERAKSDKKPANKKSKNDTPSFLHKGGPEVLATKEIQKSGRTLFLCYPDEDDDDANEKGPRASVNDDDDEAEDDDDDGVTMPTSMGWQCLHHYKGEYVIHVGETYLDANLSIEQAPWGRSSSPEFQQRLACEYHCLLKVELPNWFHTRDTITVWKRSMISTMVFAADEDDQKEDGDDDDDDDDEDEDEEVEYRHIPINERLPTNIAAPCLAHLLPTNTNYAMVPSDKKALSSPHQQQPNASKSKPDASKSPTSSKKETPERPPAASQSTKPPADTTSKTNSNKNEKKKHENKNDHHQKISGQGSTTPTTTKSQTKKDKKDTWAELDKVTDMPQRQDKKKYVTPW